MYNKDRKPANWIHQFNTEHGRISISDKGAIKVSQILPSGEERDAMFFSAKTAETAVNIAGDLANVLLSPEYKAVLAEAPKRKEQAKLENLKAKQAQRAILTAQSAFETLKSLGYDITKKQA